jgi:hypothetical protein
MSTSVEAQLEDWEGGGGCGEASRGGNRGTTASDGWSGDDTSSARLNRAEGGRKVEEGKQGH